MTSVQARALASALVAAANMAAMTEAKLKRVEAFRKFESRGLALESRNPDV